MNSLISSWTEDADWSSFACYAHQILELSHCRRNPGICRAMPLYLFEPTAPHTRGRSLQPHSPGEGWFRQRGSCAQLQPKGTALWARICCTIHEAGACLIASSSQWVCGILNLLKKNRRWYKWKLLCNEITQKPNKDYQYLAKYF